MLTTESLDTFLPAIATAPPNKLNRSLSVWNSLTIGFAVVSPVVGLYAIIGVQTVVTGGGWFAALAICLVMQLLVATVGRGHRFAAGRTRDRHWIAGAETARTSRGGRNADGSGIDFGRLAGVVRNRPSARCEY